MNEVAVETIHIIEPDMVSSYCGLWIAGNFSLSWVEFHKVEDYRHRDGCRVCEKCENARLRKLHARCIDAGMPCGSTCPGGR